MSDKTAIEWTDATWNPVRGCSRISEGCRNCYAERMAARMSDPGMWGAGFATRGPGRWTGKVELIPGKLDEPLRWREPRRIFVNSMSDLFHEALSDEAIDQVFAAMALAPQHTFQVLTKRPGRMLRYCTSIGRDDGEHEPDLDGEAMRDAMIEGAAQAMHAKSHPREDPSLWLAVHQPLPNVWLGVSVEDQATADERIPLLLQTPAAVRFISYEPALGPVSFRWAKWQPLTGRITNHLDGLRRLDWVIVGGESGPGARPFDVRWARAVVAECREVGVPVFVKQLGRWPFDGYLSDRELLEGMKGRPRPADQPLTDEQAAIIMASEGLTDPLPRYLPLKDPKGGDPAEWPEDLRVRQFPKEQS